MRRLSKSASTRLLITSLVLLGSCGKSPEISTPMPPDVVAEVGGRPIRISTLTNALARRRSGAAPEQPRAILDELIRSEALTAKARAAGYDRRPEVIEQFERLVAARFREDQLEPRLTQAAVVTDAEVQAHYTAHATNYTVPESVRAGILFLRVSSKAEPEERHRRQAEAGALLERATQTNAAGFAQLVQGRSDDQATRYTGGDTGWLTRDNSGARWPDEVVAAAFSLSEPGQYGPPIATREGFYLVRLTERKAARLRPLAEVQDAIRYALAREKRRQAEGQFYDDLKAGLKIEINQSLLDGLTVPGRSNQPGPPPLPGG